MAVLFFAAPGELLARDIDLDAIYIDPGSDLYRRLLEKKLDAYQAAGARFIDRDVIFAWWGDGLTVFYIRELPRTNIVYAYGRNSRKIEEIARMEGAITAVRNSLNGRYAFIKRLIRRGRGVPQGETVVLDLRLKRLAVLGSSYPFLDFSLGSGGNSLLYESKEGIVEYFPDGGRRTKVASKSAYSDIITVGAPVVACISPNGKKTVFMSGSGGTYRTRVTYRGKAWDLPGITSVSELFWLDNARIACRRGGAGSYSVEIYDTERKRFRALLADSLNTNINYSPYPKMLSFLHQQVIRFYDLRTNEMTNTGLEGEDVIFSPDGNRFISLYLKKLFLISTVTAKKKRAELTVSAGEIVGVYKKVLDSGKELSNDYSREYVLKKISAYGKVAR